MIAIAAAILYIIEGFHDHQQWLYGKNTPNELANIKLHKIDFLFHFVVSLIVGFSLYYDDFKGFELVYKILTVLVTMGISRLLFLSTTLNILRKNRTLYYRSTYSNAIDVFITKNNIEKAVFIVVVISWLSSVYYWFSS